MWAISRTFWNISPFSSTCFAWRKAPEISKLCKICSQGNSSYFIFPLDQCANEVFRSSAPSLTQDLYISVALHSSVSRFNDKSSADVVIRTYVRGRKRLREKQWYQIAITACLITRHSRADYISLQADLVFWLKRYFIMGKYYNLYYVW